MALMMRVARLLKADAHAVLDRLEEPDVLLAQAVRDMETSLAQDEQRLEVLSREMSQLCGRIEDIEGMRERADKEIDTCFAANNEELARTLVRRRLEAERLGEFLDRRRQELDMEITSLRQQLNDHRAQLEATRQKAALFTDNEGSAETDSLWQPATTVRDEEVEVAFLKEKQRRQPS